MNEPSGSENDRRRGEPDDAPESETHLTLDELLARGLENHPSYAALNEAFEHNFAPIRKFFDGLDVTFARLLAADKRAHELSDLLHGDIGISELRAALKDAPIDSPMTLLSLLRIERARGESKVEQKIIEAMCQRRLNSDPPSSESPK